MSMLGLRVSVGVEVLTPWYPTCLSVAANSELLSVLRGASGAVSSLTSPAYTSLA